MQEAEKNDPLANCMAADRHRLKQWHQKLRRQYKTLDANLKNNSDEATEAWQLWQIAVQHSQERVEARRLSCPSLQYDESLPIVARKADIQALIQQHPVIIVAGETGSGKTTQLPKMCLELGYGTRGLMGHTQPRRIAARSVAQRIAEELNVPLGETVGYKIRFHDRSNPNSLIKVMTDGILLAEIHHDPWLSQYDTLIIDEAHERSLNIDFILGYVKRLLTRRSDLKVIVTSATIDPERFSKFFNDAPLIEVSGRAYPVEIRYQPLNQGQEGEKGEEPDLSEAILQTVEQLLSEGRGDILVFLSGEREIRETADVLRKHNFKDVEILPLFSRLSQQEQHRIFESHSGVRIILSTNVAETSLTVPGIRYVIDSGRARISRYSHRSQIQRLPVEAISQASAKQRAGRCGRLMPGICVRLYSEEDFKQRPEFTEAEIQRTHLSAVILQMLSMDLGKIEDFPFLEKPDPRYVRDGFRLLEQIGALEEHGRLTPLGKRLARLPMDPKLGVILWHAEKRGALEEALIIVSFLSIQDPREWPLDQQQKAREIHGQHQDKQSDFLGILKLWVHLQEQRAQLSNNQFKRHCQKQLLSFFRVQDWMDTHKQLHAQLEELKVRFNLKPAPPEIIHQSLLSGLLNHLGQWRPEGDYEGIKGKRFKIFPGSALKNQTPKWIMAFEIVETSQVFARMVAPIEVSWVEIFAKHQLKRAYSDPHWQDRMQQVVAFERASFYGLPIYQGRKVDYGRVDPEDAHRIFIQSALVEGQLKTEAEFFRFNLQLIEDVEVLEHKSRRRDVLVQESDLFEFYARKIPNTVHNGVQFHEWLNTQEPDHLKFTREDLMAHEAQEITSYNFPDRLKNVADSGYELEYRFEPGNENDGICILVPVHHVSSMDPDRFEWLVPGMILEKITELIKTLPKSLRKNFIPAPEFAKVALERMTFGQGNLYQQLGLTLKQMTGVEVPNTAWNVESLPVHLKIQYGLLNDQNEVIHRNRSWQGLLEYTGGVAKTILKQRQEKHPLEQQGKHRWDFPDLSDSVQIEQDGVQVQVFPRLKDDGDSVSVQLQSDRRQAEIFHRAGLRKLLMLEEFKNVKYLRKHIPDQSTLSLLFQEWGNAEVLADQLIAAAVEATFLESREVPLSAAAFQKRLADHRGELISTFNQISEALLKILQAYQSLKKTLWLQNAPSPLKSVYTDLQAQLKRLLHPGFLEKIPRDRLMRMPIYLKGMELRLEKAKAKPAQDQDMWMKIAPLFANVEKNMDKPVYQQSELFTEYRWGVEELRISLFAQQLKAQGNVSIKRLEALWKEVEASVGREGKG